MILRPFGQLPSGATVEAYMLTNGAGASLEVITYGGIVTALRVPDRNGALADVVLGFDNLNDYLAGHPYFGAIIGRVAGRISGGLLELEGKTYPLARNNGTNHLHGGLAGFDKRIWKAEPISRPDGADSLRLGYTSPDGEDGYPGKIEIAITYTLTAKNEFIIETEATSDRVTPLSLAHHSYFNLAGEGSGTVLDHEVQILAEACVPTDAAMTLSAQRAPLTPGGNDLRQPRRLGDAVPQIFKSHGDCYLLRAPFAPQVPAPTLTARVVEPRFGRVLEVFTDEATLQFYTSVSLDGTLTGKSGKTYVPFSGLCLECQGYPDGSSLPEFGDILVRPGQTQRHRTIYAFSTL